MGWLSRLRERPTRDGVVPADDPAPWPPTLDESCWETRFRHGGRPVVIRIAGRYAPDSALLARAHGLAQTFEEVEAGVRAFLAAEASRDDWAPYAAEIRGLSIREICLFRPGRPGEAMVFFDGPDVCRGWRCALIDRVPTSLGFDSSPAGR